MRLIWLLAGIAAVALGMIGAFLPLLPTVPFMLLAAFCFARSSERLHNWLITHPTFGPQILNWQTYGAIGRRAKIYASISILVAFGLSLALGLRPLILGIQAGTLTLVALFIWTRPEA